MKYDPKKRKSTKEAHENMTFMNSREARWLRVLAELMETEALGMKKTFIRHTIVFQGSARINEESEQFKKNGYDRYYTEAYELSKQMTEWSEKLFRTQKQILYQQWRISHHGSAQQSANNDAEEENQLVFGIKLPFEQTNNDYVTPGNGFRLSLFLYTQVLVSLSSKSISCVSCADSEQWTNYLKH